MSYLSSNLHCRHIKEYIAQPNQAGMCEGLDEQQIYLGRKIG